MPVGPPPSPPLMAVWLRVTQEKRWVTTDLGPASFESEPSQATVQNAHAETHFRVHPSPKLVCSDRPEGRVLSCLDSSSTQAVSALCVRGSSISVQGPALRAGPVSLHLHEGRGGSPCSHERTGHSHPQLSRRLAHSCSVSGAVMRTQGFGAQSPQPVGPSGQLGKEQTRPSAEDLFSWYGVGFGRTVSTPHRGTCSVSVELPEYIQGQDSGPTETFSEAPGAYGSRSVSNPVRFASYETASALASRPSPEMGVATRHIPSGNHSGMPPNLQPMVRPLVSSGRSAPKAGVLACCGFHGCLCHRLGCHVQQACSVRGVDGPPTALAHQLPRVASRTPCPGPPEGAVTGQACAGPYGQYCDRCVHQPSRGSALPSHVANRQSPPLESEASEVALRHSCPWCAQPCGRRALTSCAARRVATPPPGGPADLGRVRRSSGRPVCLARNFSLPVVLLPGPPEGAVTGQACAGPYGQYCDRCVHQPSRGSALPSHVANRQSPPLESEASEVALRHSCPWCAQPCGQRALTSCAATRVATPPPGGPADLGRVRRSSGRPVCLARNFSLPVVLLPVRGNTRYRCTGAQLSPGPSQICVSPSEPTGTDLVQSQGGRGAGPASYALLAQPDLVPGTHAPHDSPSLANSSEKGPETGHCLAPASRPLETPCLVPGRDAEVLGDLPPEVLNTIASARAQSTRRAYALKWNLFVEWCSSRREHPRRCSIGVVLSFLQQALERRLSPSTLKVHAATISACHDHIDGKSVGKHDLVVRFLRGARRLNPPRPPSIPSWDLALVLRALPIASFEPLQSADLKILSMKTLLLVALASIKRVGDLQAFSVDESCLEFGPGDGHVVLRPRPGYVPKIPTTPFRVVSLQALPLEEADPALALLCPVHALRMYIDITQSLRTSDQLFVCYGGQQKGKAVSKQRMAHWIVDAIALAYQAQGVPCPLRLHAHSTRGVASSWALARGASLTDICRVAGWATPNTFARFYSPRVEPVSSRVLTSGQGH